MPPIPKSKLDTGVYCIQNRLNGKRYIGSTVQSFRKRWNIHRCTLRKGKHHSKHLQSAWILDGEQAFKFFIIERCDAAVCVEREQVYMDHFMTTDPRHGYNMYPNARSHLGIKRPPHVGKAVAEANRRRVVSEATRARMRESRKNVVVTWSCPRNTHAAKLTADDVRSIRSEYNGHNLLELAAKYQMSRLAIKRIVRRESWKHVD